jgi:VWFA-related protein
MSGRAGAAAFLIVVAAVAVQHAQTPGRPVFRAGVEYVEVDARVVDAKGEPIRDLTRADFKVFEDGVRQQIQAFSVVDIPLPAAARATAPAAPGLKPDVATNVRPAALGRTFLIVFDGLLVAPCQTLVVRKLLREFIERSMSPDDLVGIVSTGHDRSFENFTSDKPRLLAVVGSLNGQAELGPTAQDATDVAKRAVRLTGRSNAGQPDPEIGDVIVDDARQAHRRLVELVQAMSAAGEGSKAIILVSESMPHDLVTDTEGLSLLGLSLRTEVDRLATAVRRGNVPIYPVYPRGLTDGNDCETAGAPIESGSPVLAEVRRQQDNLRVIADDSGGVPIVGVNNLAGGFERIVKLSSYYYALGYSSTNSRPDGRYHKITVAATRPDARVLSRKGYTAPREVNAKDVPQLAGPPESSLELRGALNAALPVTDLPMSMTAAAFRQPGNARGASAAVVLETLGAGLAWGQNGALAAPIEMTAVALEPRGKIRTGEQGRIKVTQPAETNTRIRQFGFRWLARLDDLKPGRYQIRGVVSNGIGKQGSVWYDLEIPDFAKAPLTMSDVVLASAVASQRITVRPDTMLAAALPAPATTLRQFLAVDTIAIYAEAYDNDPRQPHEVETSVFVTNDRGEEQSRTVDTHAAMNGVLKIQTRLPLAKLVPGSYTLAVEARQTDNRAIAAGRAVPFQVVAGGNK